MKFFLGLITGKLSDPVSKLDSGIACQFKHFRGRVGLSACFQDVSGSPQRFQLASKPIEIDLTSSGVKIEMSPGEFAKFPESTSKCQAWYGVFSQVFEQTSRKIAHVQHRFFRKVVMLLYKCLTGRTSASGGMFKTVCPRHINSAVDRVNPCGTGEGNHNPCRSKDRDPIPNAQPRIPGFQGKFFSSGNRYRDPNICSSFVGFSKLFQMLTDHFSGNRIDCRFSNIKGKAGFGDRTDAFSGSEANTTSWSSEFNPRFNHRLMRHIRVISCIFDHGCNREVLTKFLTSKVERGRLTLGKGDLHRVGKSALQQRREGGFRSRSGAGSSGPAASQFLRLLLGHGIKIRQCLMNLIVTDCWDNPQPNTIRLSS